jgi:hypothetical protein
MPCSRLIGYATVTENNACVAIGNRPRLEAATQKLKPAKHTLFMPKKIYNCQQLFCYMFRSSGAIVKELRLITKKSV